MQDVDFHLLDGTKPNYIIKMEELLDSRNYNPSYSPRFNEYYSRLSNEEHTDLSILIASKVEPLIGIFISSNKTSEVSDTLEFIGRPALIVTNLKASKNEIALASKFLLTQLKNSEKHHFLFKNSSLKGKISFCAENMYSTELFETLLDKFSLGQINFYRVINLQNNSVDILKKYSKSVKSAIKQEFKSGDKVQIISFNSFSEEIEDAITNLRSLHFNSAKRITRSLETWKKQQDYIETGDAFIAQFISENRVISSAYFMKTLYSAYYGVSASNYQNNKYSLSHILVNEGILYSKQLGLNSFHLGKQLSHLNGPISDKEYNIEKFKSFFGGNIESENVFTL